MTFLGDPAFSNNSLIAGFARWNILLTDDLLIVICHAFMAMALGIMRQSRFGGIWPGDHPSMYAEKASR